MGCQAVEGALLEGDDVGLLGGDDDDGGDGDKAVGVHLATLLAAT